MDHDYFQIRLSAFADNELPADERARVAEHLEQCDECRQRLAELRRLDDLVARESDLGDGDYWEAAATRIETSIEKASTGITDLTEERRRRGLGIWWKLPAVAASILIVGYIGLHRSDILRDDVMPPPGRQETIKAAPSVGDTGPTVAGDRSAETAAIDLVPPEPTEVRTDRPASAPVEVPREDAEAAGIEVSEELASRADVSSPEPTDPGSERADAVRRESTLAIESNRAEVLKDGGDTYTPAEPQPVPAKPKFAIPTPAPAEKPARETEAGLREGVAAVGESNYKDKSRSRARGATSATQDEGDVTIRVEDADYVRSPAKVGSELESWRQRRDSLLEVVAAKSDEDKVVSRVSNFMGKTGQTDLRSALDSRSADTVRTPEEETEARLMEAWYRISALTPDSAERDRGIEFLESVVSNQESANRVQARKYLELLDRQ